MTKKTLEGVNTDPSIIQEDIREDSDRSISETTRNIGRELSNNMSFVGPFHPDVEVNEISELSRGVFANNDIPVGELIAKFDGPIIEADSCNSIEDPYIRDHVIQIAEKQYIYGQGGIMELHHNFLKSKILS